MSSRADRLFRIVQNSVERRKQLWCLWCFGKFYLNFLGFDANFRDDSAAAGRLVMEADVFAPGGLLVAPELAKISGRIVKTVVAVARRYDSS